MADQLSEQEIFDSATATEEASSPEPQREPDEQPRDDHGRFATKVVTDTNEPEPPQPQTNQPAAQQEQSSPPETAPAWALEERRRRQAAEERAQTLERQYAEAQAAQRAWQEAFQRAQTQPQQQEQPQQQGPDPDKFYENPVGFMQAQFQQFAQQYIQPIQQARVAEREYWSERNAERDYGADAVKAAKAWAESGARASDPEVAMAVHRANNTPDPYGTLVQLYQQNQAIKQVGNDPNKWFESTLEQKLSDPNFQAMLAQKLGPAQRVNPANRGGAPLVSIPSINRASGSAAMTDSAPASEEDIFAAAPRRMGRRD